MLTRSLSFAALLGVAALAGCGGDGGIKSADLPRAEFTMVSAGRVDGDPNGGEPARVSLRWPEFTSTAGAAAKDSMAAWVKSRVLAPAVENQSPGDTTAIIEQFLAVYRAFRADYPTASGGWYLERSVDVLADTFGVVTLDMRENSFGGGAHPNSARWLASFDASGHQLLLSDVLAEGQRDTIDGIAEVYFRMARQLGPSDNLEQGGYTFPGRFRVNDNVGITPAGVVVYFNAYEVAPYAMGSTEFKVPWPALKGLVREKTPWAELAR